MPRFGRSFLGRQDLRGPLGFEQPIPVVVLPSATTNAASGISGSGATLNGTVNPNGQIDCHYYFQWGLTGAYGNTTAITDAGTGTNNVAASAGITGLTTGTTYHFRVVATNANGTVYGLDQTFVPTSGPAPTVVTLPAGSITPTSSALNGTVNPNGTDTTYSFQYGTTTAYGTTTSTIDVGSGSSAITVSAPISGLVGGTVYHYRITATNANGTSNGADQTFYVPVPTPSPQPALPFQSGPTTNPFTYCCYDLVTSKYLGRLPLRGVTFGSQILTPGSFSGTIDIASSAVQNLGPLGITQPARTALLIDYLGSFIWGGVIWPRSYKFDATSRQLQVGATELWSYPAGRTQATDYSAPPFSGITGNGSYMSIWDATGTSVPEGGGGTYDPLLIAWQILSDLLYLVPSGNILGMGIAANGYTTPAAYLASGTNTLVAEYLSVNYPYNSPQQAGMMVNQLATNGYLSGFDYAVDVAGSAGGVPVATLNLSYPRRGRLYSQNNLVLDCMRALSYEFPEDGTQTANTVYEQGMSGSLSVSQNAQPLAGGYPVLEQIKSRANITSANVLTVLQGMGASDLEQLSYPVSTPSVTTDLYTGPVTLGSFVVGDDVRVRIPATDGKGGMFDPRFPTGLDEEWRISGYQATVADDGQSTLQFQLAVPPSLALPAGPPVPSGG